MSIKFTCPNCKKELVVKYLNVGDIAKCQHCGKHVTVPNEGTDSEIIMIKKSTIELLEDIEKKWENKINFGAFALTPLWLIAHGKILLGLLIMIVDFISPFIIIPLLYSRSIIYQFLSFILYFGIFLLATYFGLKGNKIALNYRKDEPIEKIRSIESKWATAGAIIVLFSILIAFLFH